MKLKRKRIVLVTLLIINAIPFIAFQEKPKFDLKASIQRGAEIYNAQCLSCHMEKGEGLESVYPPLAKSDYLMADKNRSIIQVLYGVTGEMEVKGVVYNTEMPGFDLSNEEVSDVLNYVRNSWGNKGDAVKPEDVKAARKE